jgi:hypothetical protein
VGQRKGRRFSESREKRQQQSSGASASGSQLSPLQKKSTFINLPADICAHNFRDPAIKEQLPRPAIAAALASSPSIGEFLYLSVFLLAPLRPSDPPTLRRPSPPRQSQPANGVGRQGRKKLERRTHVSSRFLARARR